MKHFSSVFGRFLFSAVLMFLLFYTMLPAINLHDQNFIVYLIFCLFIFLAVNFLTYLKHFLQGIGSGGCAYRLKRDPQSGRFVFQKQTNTSSSVSLSRPLICCFLLIALLLAFTAIVSAMGIKLFNASRYRDLITVTEGDFSVDVAELKMSQIPVVDRDTASRLGNKKLGEMTDLVSQFEIQDMYTQINYKGTPYRVTPLAYADPIKWLFNQKTGLPAYIAVNMVDQSTDLVWLESGMKYSPSEYFFRNIYRYVRFRYPTKLFETVSFEIDEEGTPYWVAPTISYRIGWWNGKDISGAVLVNAITGEAKWYTKEDVPQWIDQLYESNLIIEQLDDNGRFQNGYFNSIFGQRNVRRTTYGYNYMAIDDDVWLYTGMSSVTSDESNIGFVLVNLRTKETKFYTIPGATELAAMDSARGQVQHLNYSATFPLLLNISDRPTYFVSLKDAAGLVKMYAFVDVAQYQIVGTGASIDEARKNYHQALKLEDVSEEVQKEQLKLSGTIDRIASAVVSGNTCYYFTLKEENAIYTAFISVSEQLPFLAAGDAVTLTYTEQTMTQTKEVQTLSLDQKLQPKLPDAISSSEDAALNGQTTERTEQPNHSDFAVTNE